MIRGDGVIWMVDEVQQVENGCIFIGLWFSNWCFSTTNGLIDNKISVYDIS